MINQKDRDYVNIALPKGKLLPSTSCFLEEIGLEFTNYTKESRIYRLEAKKQERIKGKVFQDKDIPIQVAIGNYDIGICGLDWIEELTTKFPSSPIVKIANLEYDYGNIYLATSKYGNLRTLNQLIDKQKHWRVVSEYPNLAENILLNLRIPKFKIFSVKGAAEVYVPENADILVIRAKNDTEIRRNNLIPIKQVLTSSVFLIANKNSIQSKNMSQIISQFSKGLQMETKRWLQIEIKQDKYQNGTYPETDLSKVWLALPDGHQQIPTLEFLNRSALQLIGYAGEQPNRRPKSNFDWLNIKVIRPQDMPMQVANGNFDIAITGIDWFSDHIFQFPSSPVVKVLNLDFGEVKIVAVVDSSMPAKNVDTIIKLMNTRKLESFRVASEYTNIADRYLHSKRVGRYKIIPTSGATEALLPEDADMLIENTQTGKTLAAHNLRIIDTLFKSTACIIGNKNSLLSGHKKEKTKQLLNIFKQAK